MKHLLLKFVFPVLLLFPVFCFAQGDQTIIKVPIDGSGGTQMAILHLPDDYGQTTTKYPLMIFLHGVGEGSLTDPSTIYNSSNAGGPAYIIAHGSWPSSFVNPVDKKSYKYIVVSPQAAYGTSTTAPALEVILSYLIKTYRVDESRLYLTGLSAGGEGVLEYTGKIQASGAAVSATHKVAALIPMSAVMNAGYRGQYADTIVKNNVQLWGFGSPTDVHGANTLNLVLDVNAVKANYALSTAYAGGHCCWEQFYDPNYRMNGMSIYEWALQYTQGVPSAPSTTPSAPITNPVAIPGKVEAEGYSAMSGVATETTSDSGGGLDVGWIDQGDYMDYSISVATAGQYTASIRVASPGAGASFQILSSGGTVLATVNVPNTGGYQTWQTVTANLTLPAGIQTLRVKSLTSVNWNFNWIQFAQSVGSTAPAATVPGTIQAESYSAMSGVQIQPTTDSGGGSNVGWIDQGNWMDYNVNVATAGVYTVNFRVATPYSTAVFQLLSNTTVLATVNAPNTGGFQNWQTVSATVTLAAGQQKLRILSTTTWQYNVNWMQFVQAPSTQAVVPGKVEAENYSVMLGVATESTADAGGGLDVGWIDVGNYMDYNINVTAAGQYTTSFRVAAPSAGGILQMLKSDGTVLATVSVPNTGGWQNWQTVTANVTLPAGIQTLRIKSVAAAAWNLNYLQFATYVPPASSAQAIPGTIQAESYSAMSGVETQRTTDAGGGLNVGWIDVGDYMDYSVNVATAGQYTASFRVASPVTGSSLQLTTPAGVNLATVNIPQTGDWQAWQTMTASVTLPAGVQTIRVKSAGATWNFNWMQFAKATTTTMAGETGISRSAAIMSTDSATAAVTGSEFNLFPNPVHDQVTLRLNNDQTGNMLVQITDAFGTLKASYRFSKTAAFIQENLATSSYPAGIYFVRIQVGNKVFVKKIVKL